MGGQHLTWENRIAIESLLKAKVSASQIAAVVGCSKRTVYREIQRGQCEQLNGTTYEMYTIYSAQKAQNRADQMNDLHKGRPVKLCPELAAHLEDYIGTQHYSPAAAVREILLQGLALPQISANTVYRYIYRGYLHLCGLDLPVGRYNVKQKQGEQRPAKAHRNDRSIDERPPEVETREDVGFWEMDTVVGTSAGPSRCLLVLTERKTRFEIVRVLESKTAREVLRVLRELRQEFGEDFRKLFKTITCDNGCEFADAAGIERSASGKGTRTEVYYCHPYRPSERGSNENQNGLIRRHLPKGTDLSTIPYEETKRIEDWLNNYPRKMFGYLCSEQLFREEIALILAS